MTKLIISLIKLYQLTLSPDHSWLSGYFPYGYCRYTPSCSEYAKQALQSHGLVKGAYLSVRRILRCNPWAAFGKDPIPTKNKKYNLKINNKYLKIFKF